MEQAPSLPQCGAIARMPHPADLAELAPPVQHAAVGSEQARRFIEQLWEYDQIVFDATTSH